MSSAYKRHGNILERAIFERLKENAQLEVWSDPLFSVSAMADSVASESLRAPSTLLDTNIPYEPNGKRTLQVDIIVFDKQAKTLRAYEVKRGNGEHDAGKKRHILRDTLCIQVLLWKYGASRGDQASSVSSHVLAITVSFLFCAHSRSRALTLSTLLFQRLCRSGKGEPAVQGTSAFDFECLTTLYRRSACSHWMIQ